MQNILDRKPLVQSRNLSPDEDKELWLALKRSGDREARTRLLERYAPFVRYVISRMPLRQIPGLDVDDLESVGAIGLIKAIDRFDLLRNIKFETFAYRWIKGGVLDYVRKLDILSRGCRERVSRLKRAYSSLRNHLGRDPGELELADELKLTGEELNQLHIDMSTSHMVSLETGGLFPDDDGDEGGMDVEDIREKGALNELDKREIHARLRTAIAALPAAGQTVMSLYYDDDLTFKEIGEVMGGLSESRVCQIHAQSILSIRTSMEREI